MVPLAPGHPRPGSRARPDHTPTVALRPARGSDEAWLLRWRNDPAIVATTASLATVAPEVHHAWLQRRLRSPDDGRLFIIECAGRAAGMIRFDLRAAVAEISIFLIPAHTGKGVGTAALELCLRHIRADPAISAVVARVRPDNPNSLRFFQRGGFCLEPAPDRNSSLLYLRRAIGSAIAPS